MMTLRPLVIAAAGWLAAVGGTGGALRAEVVFNRDIRPILSDKCFACHGPDSGSREADLRLDQRDAALRVLAPGRPEDSELLARISDTDPDVVMPPPSTHKKVTRREAALLREWIASGAEYQPHWAFIAVQPVKPPAVDSDWVNSDLDRFVLARLQRERLTPSPLADRATLIRRVTLDLTGLPPTPEEVDAFVNDPAPLNEAYPKVVDRLLASTRLGEHLAWHWLDAARYGDSDGYESDPLRNMWPWRDWVIESFNANMPYDQFLVEQLAGDLLPNATLRQMLATGFNRNHRLNNEGGILAEEWLIEYVCDRAETTATVCMGLTWGCARCHDHKFDPITQKNYYGLFAYFHNIPEIGNGFGSSSAVPMMQVPRLDQIEPFLAAQRELEPLQKELAAVEAEPDFKTRYETWLAALTDADIEKLPKELREKPRDKWDSKLKTQARRHYLTAVDPAGSAVQKRLAPVQKRYDGLARTGARVMVMEEMPEPRKTHLLIRGAYDQPGDEVAMHTPTWLPPMDPSLPNNRLGLAQWLVSREHPLTGRVAVNRFWQLLFGIGLVKTPEDFGLQGDAPTHPELLDWLALRFIDSGWDVKALLKEIVTSSTYMQSSVATPALLERDPENRLLARGARHRLPAQVIRDQALAVSGLLVDRVGGPPVKPYQPAGLWEDIIKGRPVYKRDSGENLYRRSLYTLWRRAVKPPEMQLFDANDRDTCSVSQRRTNTPLQSLLLLNDVTYVEAARALGLRMLQVKDAAADRIQHGVRLTLARAASPEECDVLLEELAAAQAYFSQTPSAAREWISHGDSATPEGIPAAELAAYAYVARILLNLDETICRQ